MNMVHEKTHRVPSDRRRLIRYFCYFFLLLLTATVLLSVVQFIYTNSLIKQDYDINYENTFSLLRHSHDVVFDSTEYAVNGLFDNPKYEHFVNYYQNNQMVKAIEVLDDLNFIKSSVNCIENICLYYPESQLTLSTKQSVSKLEYYSDKDFLSALSYIDHPAEHTFSRTAPALFSKMPVNVVSLVRTIPRNCLVKEPIAYVIVDIKSSTMYNAFSEISMEKDSDLLIYDAYGSLIYSTGKAVELDSILSNGENITVDIQRYEVQYGGKACYAYVAASGDTGWIYVYLNDATHITERLEDIRKIFIVFCLVIIVLGAVYSAYAAYQLHKPIQAISNRLTHSHDDLDVFERIDEIIARNERMDTELMNNAITGRNEQMLHQILLGFENIENGAGQLHMQPGEKECLLCLLKTHSDDNSLSTENITQILKRHKARLVVKVYSNKQEIALVIAGGCLQHDEILSASHDLMAQTNASVLAMGISSSFTDVSSIREAYHQASTALGMMLVRGSSSICHYSDIVNPPMLSYPYKIESAIFRTVKSANRHALEENMKQFEHYLVEHDVRARIVYDFYLKLFSSAQRLMLEIDNHNEEFADFSYHDLLECNHISEMSAYMLRIFNLIIDDSEMKGEEESNLVNTVCDFIEDHLADMPTQDVLAETSSVQLSPLRREFQRVKNMSIKEYIDKVKINKAKEMLLNPENKIQDIANCMGFSYAQSFIVFFKSSTGMTPGDWREANQSNAGENDIEKI